MRCRLARQIAAAIAAALCACTVGPDYSKPADPVPDRFRGNAQENGPQIDAQWWRMFGDPALDALVAEALQKNLDLLQVLSRLDASRAALNLARSRLYPELDFAPGLTRARTSTTVADPFPRPDMTNYLVPLEASYEVDLWGKVRRSVNAAQDRLQAASDDADAARIAVAAQVVTEYFGVRSLDHQIDILGKTVDLREQAVQLTGNRFAVGAVSELDLIRARSDLASTKAELADARRRRDKVVDAIAILVGRDAPGFAIDARPAEYEVPAVPADLPGRVIERRPDVAGAERLLAASSEQIGIARADFFPSLALTGAGGVETGHFSRLLENPSLIWSIGPSVSLPVFDGGRRSASEKLAVSQYQESLEAYRKQVLTALQEVQDALADTAWLAEQNRNLRDATRTSEDAAALSLRRYEQGLVDYFEVVDSDRLALGNQLAEVQNDEARLEAAVALIKALGGGWNPPSAALARDSGHGR